METINLTPNYDNLFAFALNGISFALTEADPEVRCALTAALRMTLDEEQDPIAPAVLILREQLTDNAPSGSLSNLVGLAMLSCYTNEQRFDPAKYRRLVEVLTQS